MNNEYKFFLNFKRDNVIIEIEEPSMFDSFSHSIERKRNGFAVDMYLFAENTSLLFTNSTYSKSDMHEDIDGTLLFNLSHGLKRIIDAYNVYGPDAEIELTINYNGVQLTKCDFDLEDIDSDLLSYFKCSFIENNIRAKHKIREDDVIINLYAEKNLDNINIVKLQPINVLLLSKPTFAESKWIKSDIPYFPSIGAPAPGDVSTKLEAGSAFRYFNFCRAITKSGLEDTLVPSPLDYSNSFTDTYDGTMKILYCKTAKKDVKFKIVPDVEFIHIQNGRTGYPNKSRLSLTLRVSNGIGINDSIKYVLYDKECIGTATQTEKMPVLIEFTLPTILNEGEFVTLFWEYSWDSGTISLDGNYSAINNYSHVNFKDCTVEVTAVESTINSVIQGVRWIDCLKKSSEIISGLPVDAPRIDAGGEYYNTIISNGGGVRNISNIPFNVKTKDIFDMGKMVAQDYQITDSNIIIGEYSDFFSSRVLRVFNVKPDEKFSWNTNKEYRIKTFNYEFKNFEQDRQEQRTLDAVHTQAQILMPNLKTVNTKDVKIEQILDAYKIDSLRRLGINPDTIDSSLSDDTDLVMLKVAPIMGLRIENYIGLLNISSIPSGVKIYTDNFRWDKIGLSVASSFEILTGLNIGTYSVTVIESTVLTLAKITGGINKSENKIVSIRYSLPNVNFVSETDQEFSNITGVISKETFTNMYYSKIRNIKKWLPFLATCSMRYENGKLKISFLKSNQDLSTRLNSETINLIEKNDIEINDIAELKKITDRKFDITIYLNNPHDILEIFKEINTRNADGTIGGCYGFLDINGDTIYGYPEKLEFIPLENKIEATCLEKYEPGNGVINLEEASKLLYSQYSSYGVYFTIYNIDGTVFCKEKRFTKIKIRGIAYTDLIAFIEELDKYIS